MAVVDDAQLMKLAEHRPHPMLAVLNRTESIKPVILLLAVLPGIIVLESQPLDELSSRWGLRAVDALSATNVVEAAAPGRIQSAAELRFQPPLATWLTVAAMRLMGPAHPMSVSIVSFLAAAGVLGMAYVLLSRLAGGRVGFWTVVLLAGHSRGLELYRAPAPVALTLLFAMIVWWGVIKHRDEAETPASLILLVAGVALGLCLLSGGIVAAAVAGILAVTICVDSGRGHNRNSATNGQRRRKKRIVRSVVSLFILLLTAFAVAGWWLLMLSQEFGSEFWTGWSYAESATAREPIPGLAGTIGSFATLPGVFGVAALVGFARAIRSRGRNIESERPKRMTLIVVWTVAAGCFYVANAFVSPAIDWRSSLAEGFLLIPLFACAANLLDDVFQRRVGLISVALLTLVSLLSVVALPMWTNAPGLIRNLQVGGSVAIACIIAGLLLCRYAVQFDHRRRFAIGGMIAVLLVCNISLAIRTPYGGNADDERELRAFMSGIPKSIEVDQCLIIARRGETGERDRGGAGQRTHSTPTMPVGAPPARLEFAVRSRWPDARFRTVTDWNSAFRDRPDNTAAGGRRMLVVEWMTSREHPATIDFPGFKITQIDAARYYRRKELRAFHIQLDGSAGKP